MSAVGDANRTGLSAKAAWKLWREFTSPEEFANQFGYHPPLGLTVDRTVGSLADRAIKMALRTQARNRIECVVLFPQGRTGQPTRRATACISSQPGCGVGCPFCATGTLGFRGNLTGWEICEQVYWAGRIASSNNRRLRNVVFMGMGEPLHNRDAVFWAIATLTCQRHGFGIASRHITVSTVGVPRAMVELAARFPGVRQALSLHAATAELRRRLVPRGTADLNRLREAIREINVIQPNAAVWLEVVLIAGINDQPEHVDALMRFCESLRVEVNLIPFNPAPSLPDWQPTPRPEREAIADRLRSHGIRTMIRTSFGQQVQAACGQLAAAPPREPT